MGASHQNFTKYFLNFEEVILKIVESPRLPLFYYPKSLVGDNTDWHGH